MKDWFRTSLLIIVLLFILLTASTCGRTVRAPAGDEIMDFEGISDFDETQNYSEIQNYDKIQNYCEAKDEEDSANCLLADFRAAQAASSHAVFIPHRPHELVLFDFNDDGIPEILVLYELPNNAREGVVFQLADGDWEHRSGLGFTWLSANVADACTIINEVHAAVRKRMDYETFLESYISDFGLQTAEDFVSANMHNWEVWDFPYAPNWVASAVSVEFSVVDDSGFPRINVRLHDAGSTGIIPYIFIDGEYRQVDYNFATDLLWDNNERLIFKTSNEWDEQWHIDTYVYLKFDGEEVHFEPVAADSLILWWLPWFRFFWLVY